ncbi:MAG TPA: sugar transferase [Nocardioides sp.]|uniref:sugar transferase n=1 Tax=Nocardioides sp. TaxID=35761 RepID=UPI002F3F8FAC
MHLHHQPGEPDSLLLTSQTFRVGRARRVLDVVVASLLLLLSLPLLAVAALAVAFSDGGPVLFRQDRVGEGGHTFSLLKLRSMRISDSGPAVTASGDDRITPVGRFLRRTAIDELPQLWHVLVGQMTLVGPRPEAVSLAAAYPASCRFVLAARPGLTGPAQLRYRETSAQPPTGWDVEQWYLTRLVPVRVDADLDYLLDPSLPRTFGHLWRTALFVLGVHDESPSVAEELRAAETQTGTVARSISRGSQRALRHSPVVRSNSKL